jgi:putative endonuclease
VACLSWTAIQEPQNPGLVTERMDKQYYVYIPASRKNGTLYIGVTSDLVKRVWEHKSKVIKGFTFKYCVDKLVYYEIFGDPENAIKREKRLKCYKRQWKIDLIEKDNPEWEDLYNEIVHGFFGRAEE